MRSAGHRPQGRNNLLRKGDLVNAIPTTGSTDRLPFRTKFSFGFGALAESLSLYSFGALVTLFYNQVLGMEIWMAGLAPTIAMFTDALSDPLMGSFSDRFRSKRWGRRHPFMLLAALPIAVSFLCIFNPPDLQGWALFAWLTFWAISLRTFMTVYHVPHLALGGELTRDYTERSRVMSFNALFNVFGGGAMFKINTLIFFASSANFTNGLLNPAGYPPFALTSAAIIFLVLLSSAWFTRDRIPYLSQPAGDQPGFSARAFYQDIVKAFSNRNYMFLMIAYIFLSLMQGVRMGLNTYVNIYFWELSSEDIGSLALTLTGGFVLGFFIAAKIHDLFDKRTAIVITAASLALFPALPVILRLLGLFPANDDPALWWAIVAFGTPGAMSGAVLNISVMSAVGDIADEMELSHGVRQEGILYSARLFFAKLDSSLGQGLATMLLWIIAFPKEAKPGEVDPDIVFWLGVMESPMILPAGLLAAFFYGKYRIDKKRHEEIRAALAARQ